MRSRIVAASVVHRRGQGKVCPGKLMNTTDKVRSTLVLLTPSIHAALTKQSAKLQRRYGGRFGRAVIIRGILDGVIQAGMDFTDCPNEYLIAQRVKTMLNTGKVAS
jgi:hypothetical protein